MTDPRLFAPATERNRDAILAVLDVARLPDGTFLAPRHEDA